MKYIYYSLYQFYTRVLWKEDYFPPIVNIAGIIAFMQTIIIFVFVNFYIFHTTKSKVLSYHPIIPFTLAMVLYYLNEKYFGKRELKIIKEVDSMSISVKLLSHLFTVSIIVFLIWGHFFNGFYQFLWDTWE
jgi:hypothetical protein